MKLNGMSVVAGIPFLLYNASKNKYCKGNKTMIEQLPKAFLERMKTMLGKEYEDFLKSYEAPRQFGLRVNTLKISVEEFLKQSPFHLTKVPWTENGFYYEEADRPARHPYYASGLYYLQEPSAMAPAAILPVAPGDYVLDLCAAPGGKATELGARLKGQGMLVANEISASRAKALLRNIELCGIKNSFITNEVPKNLARVMPEFFDKVLVDAPCSGEGMFRKDMDVAKTWDESRPEFFANLQREIVSNAISMLKPGGLMLYSTCTFAPIENEGTISYILENFPEMELLEIPAYEGFSEGNPEWGNGDETLKRCVRIFPHKMAGEGHYRVKYLMDNTQGIYDELIENFYAYPALQPPMTWLDNVPPSAPSALKVTSIDNGYTELNWQPATDNDQRNKPMYVIYASNEYPVDTKKAENIVAQSIRETSYIYAPIQPWNAKKYFAVTAIDRCGNESAPINGDK